MLSIRNILVTFAFLSAVPLSLAAPAAHEDSLAQYNPIEARAAEVGTAYTPRDVDEDDDLEDGEDVLDRLMPRTSCYITSKKGHDCQSSACPAAEQCKVNDKGNCVFSKPKKDRPSGCSNCRCAKFSS